MPGSPAFRGVRPPSQPHPKARGEVPADEAPIPRPRREQGAALVRFGYRRTVERDENGKRIGAHDELDPDEAEVIRAAARLLLYSADTHNRVLALLTDPSLHTTNGNVPRHLLTGIAQCGRCGGNMVARQGRVAGNGGRQAPAYVCAKCFKVKRKEAAVDEQVDNYLTNWLQRPDILAAIGQDGHQQPPGPIPSSTATPTADADTQSEAGPAPKCPAWLLLLPDLADLVGPHAAQNWAAAPLETKRALIKAVCSVTVMPTKPGPRFDPDSVVIRAR